jgi:hypothetical protein
MGVLPVPDLDPFKNAVLESSPAHEATTLLVKPICESSLVYTEAVA